MSSRSLNRAVIKSFGRVRNLGSKVSPLYKELVEHDVLEVYFQQFSTGMLVVTGCYPVAESS